MSQMGTKRPLQLFLLILTICYLTSCDKNSSGSDDPDPSGTGQPSIEWLSEQNESQHEGYFYNAEILFKNNGGSGTVEFKASTRDVNPTASFQIASGKSYKLIVRGIVYGRSNPIYELEVGVSERFTLTIESDHAGEDFVRKFYTGIYYGGIITGINEIKCEVTS